MSLTRRDLAALDRILREAGRAEAMPRFRRLGDGDVRAKSSPTDLVTEADEAAERAIAAGLAQAFPGCLVVGEEAASADPGLIDALAGAKLAVVVDPIDGTLNYASGMPLFCVMAAVLVAGETVAASIHDPVSGSSHLALKGQGAWCEEADGRSAPLRAAAGGRPLSAMTGMVSWRYMREPERGAVTARYPAAADVSSLRCCGHEYRLAASGMVDFLIYGRMMPWDHAGGLLIYQEAGGYAAMLDGSPYRPAARDPHGVIAAPDKAAFEAVRAAFMTTDAAKRAQI
jgi:fructose-1,6-bisphosphatase/inositol monophosphatase family enzyme